MSFFNRRSPGSNPNPNGSSSLSSPLLSHDSLAPSPSPASPGYVPASPGSRISPIPFHLSPAGSPASAASPVDYSGPASPAASPGYAGWNITEPTVERAIMEAVDEYERINHGERIDIGDPNTSYRIFRYLKKNKNIIDKFLMYTTLNENQQEQVILELLDEIIYHRVGCSRIQTTENERQLEALRAAKKAESFTFFPSDATKARNAKIKELETLIAANRVKKPHLDAKSFISIISGYKTRECLFVKSLRDGFPEGENSFCGVATLPDTSGAATGIVDIVPSRIDFQLNIKGTGEVCSNSSLSLVGVDDESNELNIINALLRNRSIDGPDTNGVTIISIQPKPTGCSKCGGCSILGGAKKIKRARHSKTKSKKVRRSKSKSKKTRRKNKSRRN